MRECHRVLRPGGRLAAIAIEPASGLDDEARARAVEIGPTHLAADDSIARSAAAAGLRLLEIRDVTADFREVVESASIALADQRDGLTSEEGEEAWAEEVDRKRRMAQGVDAGLLVRTLVLAERS